ncbi:MAG: LLM class flavin-dependent oxidoreductase [SAR324 cluster bacterium]|nr:LLM class flavin-dependent oxidoreductase [SAR324 cluster bacterium]
MTKLRLGLLLPNQGIVFGAVTTAELLDMAEEADASGLFDTMFVGDNLLAKPRMESVTLLSALAMRTKKARLGTACMASFPLRDPIVLAAQWAALDNLCEGRSLLVACIGGGRGGTNVVGRFENEYKAFGIAPSERVSRLTEGIEVLRKLWTEDPASHQGRHYNFDGIAVRPRPLQQPCPPIWIANNPQAFATDRKIFERTTGRVGRIADGWMTTMATPEQFRTGWEAVREAASAHGRNPDTLESCLYYNVHVGEGDAAYNESKKFLDSYYSADFDPEFIHMWTVIGAPEACAEKIRAFGEAGVQVLSVRFTAFNQTAQMRKFMEQVVPLL